MRAAVYARVSDVQQRDKHTISSQLVVLPAYVARMGWQLCGTYTDDGKSAKAGRLAKRVGFAALLRDVAARKFDVVVCVDIDRLTRSEDLQERGEILGAFQRAGCQIAELSGGLHDLNTFGGDMMSTLRAMVAAEENRKRAERTTRGRLNAAREGKPSAKPPLGLRFDRSSATWQEAPEAALIRELYARTLAGESLVSIADDWQRRAIPTPRAGAWCQGTLYHLLGQPAYRGEWLADKARGVVVKVPPLVSEADWYAVVQRRRPMPGPRASYSNLLQGLWTCTCGGRVIVRATDERFRYYQCKQRRHGCKMPSWRIEPLDAEVWAVLCAELGRDDLADRMARQDGDGDDWGRDLVDYRARLDRLGKVEAGIVDRYHRGLLSDAVFEAEATRISSERAMLTRQVETAAMGAAAGQAQQATLQRAQRYLDELRGGLDSASPEERQEIARGVICEAELGTTWHVMVDLRDGVSSVRIRLSA